MQPLGCGEFARPMAGEIARFASRRIAAKGRGGSKAPSSPAVAFLSVVPECLNRESSGFCLDSKKLVIARI